MDKQAAPARSALRVAIAARHLRDAKGLREDAASYRKHASFDPAQRKGCAITAPMWEAEAEALERRAARVLARA